MTLNLHGYLADGYTRIPMEVLWQGIGPVKHPLALALFEAGDLMAEGRLLDPPSTSFPDSSLENVVKIAREEWIDALKYNWIEGYQAGRKLALINDERGHQYVGLHVLNNDALQDFLGEEGRAASFDDLAAMFREKFISKIDPKIYAYAAAAVASGNVDPTSKALSKHLLAIDELWSDGKISSRNLEKHLSFFATEFKRLIDFP